MEIQNKYCNCKNSCLSSRGRIPCPCRVRNEKCSEEYCTCGKSRFICSNVDGRKNKSNENETFKMCGKPFKTVAKPTAKRKISNNLPSETSKRNKGDKKTRAESGTSNEQTTIFDTVKNLSEKEAKMALVNILINTNLCLEDFFSKNETRREEQSEELTYPNLVKQSFVYQGEESSSSVQQLTASEMSPRPLQQSTESEASPSPIQHPSSPSPHSNEEFPWCNCGNCVQMPIADERLCCTRRRNTGCITQGHFRAIVLNRILFRIQMAIRNDVGALRMGDDNKAYRHAAYRQFTYWRWGRLGPKNRKVVPSCVVELIRRAFPSANGNYRGYKKPIIVRRRLANQRNIPVN